MGLRSLKQNTSYHMSNHRFVSVKHMSDSHLCSVGWSTHSLDTHTHLAQSSHADRDALAPRTLTCLPRRRFMDTGRIGKSAMHELIHSDFMLIELWNYGDSGVFMDVEKLI